MGAFHLFYGGAPEGPAGPGVPGENVDLGVPGSPWGRINKEQTLISPYRSI